MTFDSVPGRGSSDLHWGATASPMVAGHLQQVLVDLTELALQGKHAHWNAVGSNFRDVHLQLDEVVLAAREYADIVAERMRAMRAVPDARSSTVAAATRLTPASAGELDTESTVAEIGSALRAATLTVRSVRDEVEAEDPASDVLLQAIVVGLERLLWLVTAESRRPH